MKTAAKSTKKPTKKKDEISEEKLEKVSGGALTDFTSVNVGLVAEPVYKKRILP